MNLKESNRLLFLNLIPTLGILSFGVLYIFSASLYPGGSEADPTSIGFDWVQNYWCNLMNKTAINGISNPARPFAITAMIILCGSLVVFFSQFAEFFTENIFWKKIIKWSGRLSMFFATFIFTHYHDLMTIISSLFGIFVVLGIIVTVYRSDLKFYKITGNLCLIILAINNLIYYSGYYIGWLPLIQKFSFLIVLIWILGLNRVVRKQINNFIVYPSNND